jgi:hypothetical protein
MLTLLVPLYRRNRSIKAARAYGDASRHASERSKYSSSITKREAVLLRPVLLCLAMPHGLFTQLFDRAV